MISVLKMSIDEKSIKAVFTSISVKTRKSSCILVLNLLIFTGMETKQPSKTFNSTRGKTKSFLFMQHFVFKTKYCKRIVKARCEQRRVLFLAFDKAKNAHMWRGSPIRISMYGKSKPLTCKHDDSLISIHCS